MLLLAAMFAAGIGLSSAFPARFGPAFGVCVAASAAAFVYAKHFFSTCLIAAAFFSAGLIAGQASIASIAPDRVRMIYDSGMIAAGGPAVVSGTVIGFPEADTDGFHIRLNVESIVHKDELQTASGRVRLFAVSRTPEDVDNFHRLDLRPGTRVRIACELKRGDEFRNPGGLSRNAVLDWQGLDASGVIKSPLHVDVVENGDPGPFDLPFKIREKLISKFRELFSQKVAGVMIASLLGNKNFLDAETASVFREGGRFHILVISGLHITFMGGLAAIIVGWLTRRRWLQFAVVYTFLWLYTIAVGAEVPVVRASLMFTVLWFAFVVQRTGSLANALGFCGLILLTWRPTDLFTPSFQLTFVSVSAIVLAGFPLVTNLKRIGEWTPTSAEPFPANTPDWLRRFSETLYWDPHRWKIRAARNVWKANLFKEPFFEIRRPIQKILAYLFEGIAVSLIVQIAMLPLVVHYFHGVNPASALFNIWAGAFIALESFSSLIAILFSYVSNALAVPMILMTESFHWLLVDVPSYFLRSSWVSFRVPVYSGAEAYLYCSYLFLILIAAAYLFYWDPFKWRMERIGRDTAYKMRLVMAAILLLAGTMIFHPFSEPRPDGSLHVEFLDVGQGDSIFITFPNGDTMLIDGGGRTTFGDRREDAFQPDVQSIGETVVSEFLWEKGYSSIGHVVGTHADADHIQGLTDVVRNFHIGQAWFGRPGPNDPDQLRLELELNRTGTPINNLSAGDSFTIGGTLVEVLHPSASDPTQTEENDRSLVLRLTFGDRSFLLTGDIERLAESEILGSGVRLGSDVVKVPHHGSKTSSTQAFVNAAHPRYAVIPVGRKSVFGHPNREVVERWQTAGANVLTTGEAGTISFTTDGNELIVNSYVRENF